MTSVFSSNRAATWYPIAISFSIGILFCVLAGRMLIDLRDAAHMKAEQNAHNVLTLIEQDLNRSIEAIGLALEGIADAIQRSDVRNLPPDLRQLVIFDRSTSAKNYGALAVFDKMGELQLEDKIYPPRKIRPVVDRDYFKAQLDRGAGLFVSGPYISRLLGTDVIGFSRRLENRDGSFAGVALGTLQVGYLSDLFASLNLGSGAIISLLRTDGTLLAREPEPQPGALLNLSSSPVFQRMLIEGRGQFVARSRIDNVERLYSFKRLAGLPLIISVAPSTQDIYAGWWAKAVPMAAMTLAVSLATIFLTWMLIRELRTRNEVEDSLVLANEKLALLSITDGLTGLVNRRRFDELLSREVRRAGRNSSPLSLILIDADNFKGFNDRYGHHEGDQVLKSISTCLSTAVTRPEDQACRIGGEEFAVLLPDTPAISAEEIGEKIRRAIKSLRILHEGSGAGVVTISIGFATLLPLENTDQFYRRADRALYRSKKLGRDQVSGWGALQLSVQSA